MHAEDLREVLRQSADRPTGELDMTAIRNRAARDRRARRMTVLGGAASAVVVLAAVLLGTNLPGSLFGSTVAPAGTAPAGSYVFPEASVRLEPGSSSPSPSRKQWARIRFHYAWSSDTHPGVHQCTWRVYGPDGTVVGEVRKRFSANDAAGAATQTVLVDGAPRRAEVTCDPEILGVPGDVEGG